VSEPVPPNVIMAFGAVAPPQSDIAALNVHLGGTKEVSSFMVKLQNWNGKYSPNGVYPIAVGLDGYIRVGRAPYCPQLITCRVEGVGYETSPTEAYVTITGRCWGEKLFRYTVTKNYLAQKGEAIVKDILDYFAGLSHVRNSYELVENTDTTFSSLNYEDSPAWDILKYVAETADKAGAIGFDFRVEPDGKFAFFPKNSKVHSILQINENVDLSTRYRKSITRVRNRVKIFGLADKSYPTDKISWTRSLAPADGSWAAYIGSVSLDATGAPDSGACIKLSVTNNDAAVVDLNFTAGHEPNCNLYPVLDLQLKLEDTLSGNGLLLLIDNGGRYASKTISVSPDEEFHVIETGVGDTYTNQWEHVDSGFNWAAITKARVSLRFPSGIGSGAFWVHRLFVGGRRFSAIQEDAVSQASYGTREYVETDEELWTDNECDLRAKALLAFLKDPDVFLTVKSTLFVYNDAPILPGDKLKVWLPNEGISDTYFRIDSADYDIPEGNTNTLEMTLELEKVHPQIADYIYGLRTFTVNVEKLSRTKTGRRGTPVLTGGSMAAPSRFTTNLEIDKISPVLNLYISSVLKAAFGHDGSNTILSSFAGHLVLYSATGKVLPPVSGGATVPIDLGDGVNSIKFSNGYFSGLIDIGWLNIGGFTVINSSRQLVNTSVSADSIDRDGWTGDIPAGSIVHVSHGKVTGYN
jgi:hypothetical protein